jgi:hypothetical protein
MNRTQRSWLRVATLAICLAASLPAGLRADTEFTVNNVTGIAGQEVTVYGTISHTGSDTTNLNGLTSNLKSPFIFPNGLDFVLNAPFSLTGTASSGLIALFTFEIAPGTASGMYSGNELDILGGPGLFDTKTIAMADFSVDVTGGTKKTPEPGVLALLLASLAAAMLVVSKWRVPLAA